MLLSNSGKTNDIGTPYSTYRVRNRPSWQSLQNRGDVPANLIRFVKYTTIQGGSVINAFVFILLLFFIVSADNPVINHMYTADPAALVYKDTCFIFTGHDEGSTGYVMHDWYVFSSTDMVHWTDHGARLKVSEFSWASQVIESEGKFYWYICAQTHAGGKGVGVAVADHPLGPYKDARGTAPKLKKTESRSSLRLDRS